MIRLTKAHFLAFIILLVWGGPCYEAFAQQQCPGGDAGSDYLSNSGKNQCWYGGCFPLDSIAADDRPQRVCAYSEWFCPFGWQFVTARELYEMGEQPCTCEDVANYPATIGICDFSGGIVAPMIDRDENCPRDIGTPVCRSRSEPDLLEYNYYTAGDPTGTVGPVFTACDLPCSANFGQRRSLVDGEAEGCEYPVLEWLTSSVDNSTKFWPRDGYVFEGLLYVIGDVHSNNRNKNSANLVLQGPFTKDDPSGTLADKVVADIKYPEFAGNDPETGEERFSNDEFGVAVINATTGAPIDFIHFGENFHTDHGWCISANRVDGQLVAVTGGKYTGSFEVETSVCTPIINGLSVLTCAGTDGGRFVTTLTLSGNPDLDVLTLPDAPYAEMGGMATAVQYLELLDTPGENGILNQFRWMTTPFGGTFSANVRDVAMDSNGDVYALGRECSGDPSVDASDGSEDGCIAYLAKLAAADGSYLLKKAFPYIYSAYHMVLDEQAGMIIFSGDMMDGSSDDTDVVKCQNTKQQGQRCAILIAVDLQGERIWARTGEQLENYGSFLGRVAFAFPDEDGPYVYVAFTGVYDELDQGTPYPVCLNNSTGAKTPIYEVIRDRLPTSADCPEGTIFMSSTTSEAMPAVAANTGAFCGGMRANGCAMKYHKYTGLPIWGSSIVDARAVGVTPEGLAIAGSYYYADEAMAQTTLIGGENTVSYQSLIDKDTGRVRYVQALANPTGWSQTYAAASGPTGDFYVIIGHESHDFRGNNGFQLNLPLGDQSDESWSSRQMGVEKYSTGRNGSTMVADCIRTCNNSNSRNVIRSGYCYVNHVCYRNGETMEVVGSSKCMVCDSSVDQKSLQKVAGCGEEDTSSATEPPPAPAPTTATTPTNPAPTTTPVTNNSPVANQVEPVVSQSLESEEQGISAGGIAGIVIGVAILLTGVAWFATRGKGWPTTGKEYDTTSSQQMSKDPNAIVDA